MDPLAWLVIISMAGLFLSLRIIAGHWQRHLNCPGAKRLAAAFFLLLAVGFIDVVLLMTL